MKHCVMTGTTTAMLLGFVATAGAQIVTVTTAEDRVDIDWQTARIEDLPGPDGKISFAEAMIATNNTPGHQTIGFAIPQNEWILQFLFPGCAVLTSNTGFFFRSSDEVTIDGRTQTAFTGDTNPDGWEVVIYGTETYLNADGSELFGFHSSPFSVSGSHCVVEGNTGTMNISLFGGSGSVVKDNRAGTIKIDRSSDNIITGNTAQRIRVLGGGVGQPAANNRIGGPASADRNYITGYGTVNSEGLPSGQAIQLAWADGTLIENNSIGTTRDGLEQGNLACTMGIGFDNDNQYVTIRNNRIAGILGRGQGPHYAGVLFGWGIHIGGAGSNIVIEGNTIGLNANGQATLGSVTGIDAGRNAFGSLSGIRIGGSEPGQGNVIAGHRLEGIAVGRTVPSARISGNQIYENGALGIDLIPTGFGSGVTPNDPLDTDMGGNGLQNFPVLATARSEGGSVRIAGTLGSSPLGEFTIEFFASPMCDGSGHGEGQEFLGSTSVSTDGNGDAAFDVLLGGSVQPGWVVTATATLEPIGATSEFSSCIDVTTRGSVALSLGGTCPGQISVTWNGATPGRPMGVLFARNTGTFVVASGPCAGTRLGLGAAQLQLAARISTGPDGSGRANASVSGGACGGHLQLVVADGSPCATSNVAQLP